MALRKSLFSLRSGRERKAWGVSPRVCAFKVVARDNGRCPLFISAFAALSRAFDLYDWLPGADAPGFILTPASQVKTLAPHEIRVRIRILRQGWSAE